MITIIILSILSIACNKEKSYPMKHKIDPEIEKYWYAGEAEITSFKLSQARYGEMREGNAVMVFVTEPFSKKSMTKADRPGNDDPSVLKMNFTKNFNTGIYPYSLMNSSFYPIDEGKHSLKISSSSQEWCGHSYMELKNENKFSISTSSYFQGESKEISLSKDYLEDDVWSMIRLRPSSLPTGNLKMIPSFFYIRLTHVETKAYSCNAKVIDNNNGTKCYVVTYPDLDRELSITYEASFPHKIKSWEESYMDGYGSNRKKLTTSGQAIKTIKSDYWNKNKNTDATLRTELGLD